MSEPNETGLSSSPGDEDKESRAAILTYHSIDDSGSVISTAPERFRDQMRHLSESGVRVISLREITSCIRRNVAFPARSVALTFDDGFKNVYDVAYPVLREFGFPATVFLVSGYCGKTNQWNKPSEKVPILPLMDWDEINAMAQNGVDFGAHTVTHPNLAKIPFERAVREIRDSKVSIEKSLGREVDLFAYPYGGYTAAIRDFSRDEFDGTCSTRLAYVTSQSQRSFLPRIDMYYFSQNNLFSKYGTRRFSCYMKCRSLLRRLRALTDS